MSSSRAHSSRRNVLFAFAVALGCSKGPTADASASDAIAVADAKGPSDSNPPPEAPGSLTWTAVRGGEQCGLFSAGGVANVTPRAWTSCGHGGCETAPAVAFAQTVALRASSVASNIAGDVIFRTVMSDGTNRSVQIWRLSDGATSAIIQQRDNFASCLPIGGGSDASVVAFYGATRGLLVGRVTRDTPVAWPNDWVQTPAGVRSLFSYNELWGAAFKDDTVRLFATGSSTLKVTDTVPGAGFKSTSAPGRAFWSAWDAGTGREIVRGIGKDGVAATYVAHDANVHVVAASPERLAWIGTHGPLAREGTYTAAELYWSALPSVPADVAITRGPSLTASTDLSHLQIGGDYAATIGCTGAAASDCALIVVNLGSMKVWRLKSRPGNVFTEVLAVNSDSVILAEVAAPFSGSEAQLFKRFVRLRTASLDSLQSAW